MLERQLKGVPKEDQEKMISMISDNPEFFQKIAEEIKSKMDSGQDQMKATMEVMKRHQEELKKISQS